jgi:hypothetical protein
MAVPSGDYSRQPPCCAAFFECRARDRNRTAEHKKKTMKTNTSKPVEISKQPIKTQGLPSRPEQLNTGNTQQKNVSDGIPASRIDFDRRRVNRQLGTQDLLALLRTEAPRFYELAEVVGKWVWVQFTEKQPSDITARLAEFGFHWNNKRQVWQHPCGAPTVDASQDDPRAKYGSRHPADMQPA